MKQLFPFLLLFFIVTSCHQNPGMPASDSSKTKDTSTVSKIPESDSMTMTGGRETNTAASTITWQELLQMEQTWLTSRWDKFIPKKGFRRVSGTPFSNGRTAIFEKTKPSELLEISDVAYDDGDNTVVIDYYMASEADYKAFADALQTSTFKYSKQNKRYETFISTYEKSFFVLHGKVLEREKTYYRVQYHHTVGKELSAPKPVLPADTVK